MSATKLDKLLKSGAAGGLEKLVRNAQNMGVLADTLRASIDPDAALNLLAANLREGGELVVVCTSSAWASRIRFEESVLIEAAQATGYEAKTLSVRVSQG